MGTPSARLDRSRLEKMMRALLMTRDEEIGCETCFDHVDKYAEMIHMGKDPVEVMPLVKEHLDLCGNCREEFEALLDALKAIE